MNMKKRQVVEGKSFPHELAKLKDEAMKAFEKKDFTRSQYLFFQLMVNTAGQDKYANECCECQCYLALSFFQFKEDYESFIDVLTEAAKSNKDLVKELLCKEFGEGYIQHLHRALLHGLKEKEVQFQTLYNGVELLRSFNNGMQRELHFSCACLLFEKHLNILVGNLEIRYLSMDFIMELTDIWLSSGCFRLKKGVIDSVFFNVVLNICSISCFKNFPFFIETNARALVFLQIINFMADGIVSNRNAFCDDAVHFGNVGNNIYESFQSELASHVEQARFDEALILIKICMALATALNYSNEVVRELFTFMASVHLAVGLHGELPLLIRSGLGKSTKKDEGIAMQWADIARQVMSMEDSIKIYLCALEVLPTDNTLLHAEISSVLSLKYIKVKNLEEALIHGQSSLALNPQCSMGYLGVGKVLLKMKKFDECISKLQTGLQLNCKDSVKLPLLMTLLKARVKNGDTSYINVKVPKELAEEVVKKLSSKSKESSWKKLENLVLYTSLAKEINISVIPVDFAFRHDLSKEFVEYLSEGNCGMDISMDIIEKSLQKDWYDITANFIIQNEKKSCKKKMSAILVGTKLSIKTGKVLLLQKLLSLKDNATTAEVINGALSYCFHDVSSQNRIDSIKILIQASIRLNYKIDTFYLMKKIRLSDPRSKFLDMKSSEVVPSVNENIPHVKSKKKKKKRVKCLEKEVVSVESNEVINSNNEGMEIIWNDITKLIGSIDFNPEERSNRDDENCVHEDIAEGGTIRSGDGDISNKLSDGSNSFTRSEKVISKANDLGIDGMPWEVECTEAVWLILKNEEVPSYIKERFIAAVQMLASGNWRRRLIKPVKHKKPGIRIYRAKITKGSHILWETSISFSARCSLIHEKSGAYDPSELCEKGAVYVDKIRIWNIALKSQDIPFMVNQILLSHQRGKSCLVQKQLKNIKQGPLEVNHEKLPNIYVNESFVKEYLSKVEKCRSNTEVGTSKYIFFPPASPSEHEYNILKFYAVTSTMAARILSLKDLKMDTPFQVSDLEHAIINIDPRYTCAILLIGRSGTGKTTCCLYRLFKHYQQYWQAAVHAGPHIPKFKYPAHIDSEMELQDGMKPKLSQEPVQEEKEGFSISCLCDGSCNCEFLYFTPLGKSPQCDNLISHDIQSSEVCEANIASSCDSILEGDVERDSDYEHLRQLFVTKNEVLCNEIKKNFGELCAGFSSHDHENIRSKDFVNIKDISPDSYPLFINSKDLLVLLDGSLGGTPFFERDQNGLMRNEIEGWGKNKINASFISPMDDDGYILESDDENDGEEYLKNVESWKPVSKIKEVTYDVFRSEIWPRLSIKQEELYHSSLVWMEIKSFIKGSAESFLNDSGYLTKDEYVHIGRKRAWNFTGNREKVYDMFLKYNKLKVSFGYFDEMDVHFNIYKRLKDTVIPVWGFHQIYVDETQDFTQGELLLLLRCSLNPNAMFFSGDTAQSIISGVSFRFCDLKSLFQIAKQEFEKCRIISPVNVPKQVHQLTHNYRSHSGIINLASSVIKLLELFFPESFDRLNPDVGLFSGPKPVILDTNDFAELTMLLTGAKRKTSTIEFGAHQVVLVQNEIAKSSLPPELSYGLVLSVYEAKGLEFDDVLLYNFFKDSPAYEEWRVISNNIENIAEDELECSDFSLRVKLEEQLECQSRALAFDVNKHKLLNSELKKLYTAITRARVNLWIFDEDKVKRGPLFEMFLKKDLVHVMTPGKDELEQKGFTEQCSEEDWRRQGQSFYDKALWKLALKCFERGNDNKMQGKCLAHIQGLYAEEITREWKIKKTEKLYKLVRQEFAKAAKMFLEQLLIEEAMICLKNIKKWKQLALLYEKQNQYAAAARVYKKEDRFYEDAIRCFKQAGEYISAVNLLINTERYMEALLLISECESCVSDPFEKHTLEKLKKTAGDKACERLHSEGLWNELQGALKYLSYEDQFNFLKSKKDCEHLLIQLYKDFDKRDSLIQFYLGKQKYIEAAEIAINVESKGKYLLMAARQKFRSDPKEQVASSILVPEFKMLLERMENDDNQVTSLRVDLMFHLMQMENTFDKIEDIIIHYSNAKNYLMVLICFDHWIAVNPMGVCNNIARSRKKKNGMLPYLMNSVGNSFDIVAKLLTGHNVDTLSEFIVMSGFKRSLTNQNNFVCHDETILSYFNEIARSTHHSTHLSESMNHFRSITMILGKIFFKLSSAFVCHLYENFQANIEHSIVQLNPSVRVFDTCAITHGLPTVTSFQCGRTLILCLFQLRGFCQKAIEALSDIESVIELKTLYGVIKPDKYLSLVFNFVIHYLPYTHALNRIDFVNFFGDFPESAAAQVISCIRRFWDECSYISVNDYVQISFISYLLDKKRPVADELLAMSVKHRQHNGKSSNFYDIFLRINNYLTHLYYGYHVVNAMNEIHIITQHILTKSYVKPSLITICMVLEMPIIILLCSMCKVTSSSLFLPSSYFKFKGICDSFYSIEGESGFDKAVSKLFPPKKNTLKEHLDQIIGYLVGTGKKQIKPVTVIARRLRRITGKKEVSCAYDEMVCERFLVLYYVILSNLPGCALIRNAFQVNKVETDGVLSHYFNSLSSIKTSEDAVQHLSSLLSRKGDTVNTYRWNFQRNQFWDQTQFELLNYDEGGLSLETCIDKCKTAIISGKSVQPEEFVNEKRANGHESIKSISNVSLGEMQGDNTFNNVLVDQEESVEGSSYHSFGGAFKKNASDNEEENEDIVCANKAKVRKDLDIEENVAATFIQKWWKGCKQKRIMLHKEKINDFRTTAAVKIQLWWRAMKVTNMNLVLNISDQHSHEKYFNSKNECIACNKKVDSKPDHLGGDIHFKMVDLYETFHALDETACKLHEDVKECKERYPHKVSDEDEAILGKIVLSITYAKKLKNWEKSEELEKLISILRLKLSQVCADQREDEEFQNLSTVSKRKKKSEKKAKKKSKKRSKK